MGEVTVTETEAVQTEGGIDHETTWSSVGSHLSDPLSCWNKPQTWAANKPAAAVEPGVAVSDRYRPLYALHSTDT